MKSSDGRGANARRWSKFDRMSGRGAVAAQLRTITYLRELVAAYCWITPVRPITTWPSVANTIMTLTQEGPDLKGS